MQEYWVNVYEHMSIGNFFEEKGKAYFNSVFRENTFGDKTLYRIHVKMKPKPKYEEIPYLNSGSKFY